MQHFALANVSAVGLAVVDHLVAALHQAQQFSWGRGLRLCLLLRHTELHVCAAIWLGPQRGMSAISVYEDIGWALLLCSYLHLHGPLLLLHIELHGRRD